MSDYIEFSTDESIFLSRFALGNPIHDGVIPPARQDVKGIRIDGEMVSFRNEETTDRLHRALYESEKLQKRHVAIDCLAFVALLASEDLTHMPDWSVMSFPPVSRNWYDPSQGPSIDPLYLIERVGEAMDYVHAIYPAHMDNKEAYLHKLGSGPVVISSYSDATSMYGSRSADSMPLLRYGEPKPLPRPAKYIN